MQNPYAAPQADLDATDHESERIRRQHIAHEASIKSVGSLFRIVGILNIPLFLLFFLIILTMHRSEWKDPDAVVLFTLLLLLLMLLLWTGYKLRQLKSSARIPTIFLAVLLLFGFPVGTLLGAYIIYLLLCEKGRTILSDEYARIIEQTPHIKYKFMTMRIILVAAIIIFIALLFLHQFTK